MIINRMTATFGRLKNETIELEPGLNIIEAPNEHGKTTWCGFIDAMLYGVDTSERDRAGHLAAKTRFRPWSGDSMSGTMELTYMDQALTIQRTTKGSSPLKSFAALKTGTAEFDKSLSGENVGEALTGVTREVFERTAFISRPELRITQTSELEKRIASLVSSGEEGVSFSETEQLIRSWQRRLRFNKNGSIPKLENQIRETQKKLELIENSSDEVSNLHSNMDRLNKQIELLKRDLDIHDQLDRRATVRRLRDARDNAVSAEKRVATLRASLTKNGHEMTRSDIKNIRETASSVLPLRTVSEEAEKALWNAEKALSDTTAKRAASPLSGRSEEAVSQDIAKAKVLEERLRGADERKIPKWIPTLLVTAGLLALLLFSGILSPFGSWIPAAEPYVKGSVWGSFFSAVVLATGVVLFFIKPPQPHADADALTRVLSPYGASSSEKLSSMLAAYSALCREESENTVLRDSARNAYESACASAEAASSEAVARLSAFMPEVRSGDEVVEALDETERLIDELTKAEFDMISSQNVYETLLSSFEGPDELDDTYLPTPLRNREDTKAAILRTQSQLNEATRAFDIATGAARSLGDPSVIRGDLESLQARLTTETEKYEALTLAADVLGEANTELQTRFSPLVSLRAGELMSRLTGGRYEKLIFDKGFNAGAKPAGDSVSRSVLALSEGTADEVYFSLRLAMCELILGGSDPCPIILDDALSSFDDERCLRALDLMLELGSTRQILLFTCHSRERTLMEGRTGVNIITL